MSKVFCLLSHLSSLIVQSLAIMLVRSIFSCFHNVFYSFGQKLHSFTFRKRARRGVQNATLLSIYRARSINIFFVTFFSCDFFSSYQKTVTFFSYICIYPFTNKSMLLRVYSTSLLKTLREKEKMLGTINFSFSHSFFYPFGELSTIFIKVEIVICKL